MNRALVAGVKFLRDHQQADGSFLSYSSFESADFRQAVAYHSVFPGALILHCLAALPDLTEGQRLGTALEQFLWQEKSDHFSWNYWSRQSPEAREWPYPDDLDDTCCSLAALLSHHSALVSADSWAHFVTLLTFVETREGGPYRTWCVPSEANSRWTDVDLAVNCNVAYVLSWQEIVLPALTELMEAAITRNDYTSRYYPSPYPVIYFLARAYQGKYQTPLTHFLLERREKEGQWENPLYTALVINALLASGVSPQELRQSLTYIREQQHEGGWKAYAFCLDPVRDNKKTYAGSAALTTAFCLEALARADTLLSRSTRRFRREPIITEIYDGIRQSVTARLTNLPQDLQVPAKKIFEKVMHYDQKKGLSVTPYVFLQALGKGRGDIEADFLISAGQLTVYGWMAYGIYDDFIDNEGNISHLAVANFALRELMKDITQLLPPSKKFTEYAQSVLDRMEAATSWEVNSCRALEPLRIPDYGNGQILANRSAGQSLSTVAVLVHLGYDYQSQVVGGVEKFFQHYLIARQLLDEAHDWEEDLRRGHINAVAALVLQEYEARYGRQDTLPDIARDLRPLFWLFVIQKVSAMILDQLTRAQEAIAARSAFGQPAFLEELLTPLTKATQSTLQEQSTTQAFIHAYQKLGQL